MNCVWVKFVEYLYADVHVDLPKHVVSVVLDGEESCLEFIEQPTIDVGYVITSLKERK